MRDDELARWCADRAGVALLAERARPGADVGDRGDALAHRLILDDLRAARPHDVVLSEEADDDTARLDAERVWIVDPLDGTREYRDPGSTEWAVHVALWTRDAGLVAGAVALPERGLTLGTDRPSPPPPSGDRLRFTVSRSRPPEVALRAAAAFDAELVPLGSAGYKVAAVALGEVDAYVHAGGQYQWDSAAPVALALAAGLHASRRTARQPPRRRAVALQRRRPLRARPAGLSPGTGRGSAARRRGLTDRRPVTTIA